MIQEKFTLELRYFSYYFKFIQLIQLFLKFYIQIANSQDATIIRNLLLATNDSKVINAIPSSLFSSLPIDISGIPLNNIPTAYVYIFYVQFNLH